MLAALIPVLGAVVAFVPASVPPVAPSCPDVDGVGRLIAPGNVVLVGELHGTQESPAFVSAVACHALGAGLPVTIGLEINTGEQASIDDFLVSSGAASDVEALLGGQFWTVGLQDGRSSRAMLGLLDAAREARAGGAALDVVTLDASGSLDRDSAMAVGVVGAAHANVDGLVITLTGNVHAATETGDGADPSFQPMGAQVAEVLGDDRVIALDVEFVGGTAWVTLDGETSGEQYFGERVTDPRPVTPAVTLSDPPEGGFDGVYDVGFIHASPPAVAG